MAYNTKPLYKENVYKKFTIVVVHWDKIFAAYCRGGGSLYYREMSAKLTEGRGSCWEIIRPQSPPLDDFQCLRATARVAPTEKF